MSIGRYELLIWVWSTSWLVCVSFGYEPVDNYLIDCGSSTNKSVFNRVFVADNLDPTILSTQQNISVSSSSPDLDLYQTARILLGTSSNYTFRIKKRGRHWIRLHFFPFLNEDYNLSTSRFSVSAQSFTLLRDFQPLNAPVVKEYSLNVTFDNLVLTFTPSRGSFAFLNALELFSIPDELIPASVNNFDPPREPYNMWTQALETVARVNMGNETVYPQNDTLWRLWEADGTFLIHSNLVTFMSNISNVNYTGSTVSENIAPASVYGTATRMDSQSDPNTLVNITWSFHVDAGFEYMVRFHFCNILVPNNIFNLYIDSRLVAENLDLSNRTSNISGAPYYMDVITRLGNSPNLAVRVAPSSFGNAYPDGILSGLEIMKMNNSLGSLDLVDSGIDSSNSSSKLKLWVIAGSAVGVLFFVVAVILVLYIRRRRNKKPAHVGHFSADGGESFQTYTSGTANFSKSKMGYRFPLKAVKEATKNFSEDLVIGVGGFGKVYKGILRDNTTVAVKRGLSDSHQGLTEFRTEIEMLSQFRHRHLVSLIGYCDEKNEMIIIYEYMENGTLKNHLYGSDLPKLNWRQRLDICIGSARGLHYLHTGSSKSIIHRDVKSANILLDENLMAKVADFGLSKNGPEIDQTHVSTMFKGSFGYLDPEYLIRQQLNEKSDVYSFGVVMFEILCGRPVIDPSLPREMVNLIELAMKEQQNGELEKIVDPYLVDKIKPESLKKFGETAEKCLAECGVDRPAMGDVLWNLECALRLQGNDARPRMNSLDHSNIQTETSVSTTQFSVGSAADIADVSMSRVFSQMMKAEMR